MVSEKIKKAREQKGFSQEYVAHELSMSQQNYSRIESGDVNPKFETIAHIASMLDISLDELTDRAIQINNSMAFNGNNNVYHSPKEALLWEKLVEEKEQLIQSLRSENELLREINAMLKAGR